MLQSTSGRYCWWDCWRIASVGVLGASILLSSGGCLGLPVRGPAAMRSTTFVAFDIETTGFSPRTERVIEIAGVKFRGGRILAEKSWLVRPGVPVSEFAQRVHGISQEMVSDSASFHEVFPEVKEFFGSSVLLAHNAGRFDVRFLSAEMSRNGIAPPSNDILDTLILFRQWFPEAERHALDVVATHVGVRIVDRHRALGDARCLYEVFCRGLSRAPADLKLADFASTKGALVHFE